MNPTSLQHSIDRCPTKVPLTRDEAISEAERLGYPIVPYKCPNGYDHWHVGTSHKTADDFHNHRHIWEDRPRNNDTYTHKCTRCGNEWSSTTEAPTRCPGCKSNSYDTPTNPHSFHRGNVRRG